MSVEFIGGIGIDGWNKPCYEALPQMKWLATFETSKMRYLLKTPS
jgi:hypothetical protein